MKFDEDVDENTCNLVNFPPELVETSPFWWSIQITWDPRSNIIKTTPNTANNQAIAQIICPPGEIVAIYLDPEAMKCTLEHILVRLCMNSCLNDRIFDQNRVIQHFNERIRTSSPPLREQYSSLLTSSAMCRRIIMVPMSARVWPFSGGPKLFMDSAKNAGYLRLAFEYPWSDTVALDPKQEHDGTLEINFSHLGQVMDDFEELTNEVIFRHTEVPYRRKVGGDGAFWFFCDDSRV